MLIDPSHLRRYIPRHFQRSSGTAHPLRAGSLRAGKNQNNPKEEAP
ncbi:hypothetical protein C4K03_3611 [Pseudomonas synxantha]|uniref:Uncharacterized protein n=1 Tax=Pseudomonas synxantha TaxID=47883 RepID=A0A3G7U8R3_9PSED|nr:hypothetical protein C4K03_3611 [Pseudomonas synxantha]